MNIVAGRRSFDARAIHIASLAIQAILYETACSPSPGLVSRISNGAHKDMNYFTFLDSSAALIKPLIRCAEAGISGHSPPEIFQRIRQIGRRGEVEMFRKTGGINTHKGALFLLGICCAAAGKILWEGAGFSELPHLIREMSAGLVERELRSRFEAGKETSKAALTHGEQLFWEHKITGIRGEAERGIPTAFEMALPFYKENFDLELNLRLVQTLLFIIQGCEDTNVLHRHDAKTLAEVQARAKAVLALGGVRTRRGSKGLEEMAEEFDRRGISPGGSADLLGVTVFLSLLEEWLDSETIKIIKKRKHIIMYTNCAKFKKE